MEAGVARRVQVLDVPVDQADQEQALQRIEQLLGDGGKHQLILLGVRKLFRARRDPEFRRCLREASLILPESASVVRAARFLKRGSLTCFGSFSLVVQVLALAERRGRTVYLLGAHKEELERAERNLKDSFPGLRLVGRFAGYHSREMEKDVLLAIRKASPSFLLVGNGLAGRDLWVLRHKKELQPGVYLWAGECFDRFSGKRGSSGGAPRSGPLSLAWFWFLVLLSRLFGR